MPGQATSTTPTIPRATLEIRMSLRRPRCRPVLVPLGTRGRPLPGMPRRSHWRTCRIRWAGRRWRGW